MLESVAKWWVGDDTHTGPNTIQTYLELRYVPCARQRVIVSEEKKRFMEEELARRVEGKYFWMDPWAVATVPMSDWLIRYRVHKIRIWQN